MSRLSAILEELIEVRDDLYTLINDKDKAKDLRIAALGEYDEVALRVRNLLARDLEEDIAKLDKLADKVQEAHAEVMEVLADAEQAADIVKGVSKYLGYVDKLLDKAKLVLPML